ncbi:hypothetical protein, partial [Klebsiella pneumoniae]|uniref:hypothetical protein n=1 Tax=Klebsiella pneumoniae TaxID=573 RepID=UPI001D103C8C
IGSFMPEKVTSLNGLKVTLEYGSYNATSLNAFYVKYHALNVYSRHDDPLRQYQFQINAVVMMI